MDIFNRKKVAELQKTISEVTAYACGKGKSCSNFVQMRNDQ